MKKEKMFEIDTNAVAFTWDARPTLFLVEEFKSMKFADSVAHATIFRFVTIA